MTYQIVLKELAQLQAKDNQGKAASMSYNTFVAIAGRNNPADAVYLILSNGCLCLWCMGLLMQDCLCVHCIILGMM